MARIDKNHPLTIWRRENDRLPMHALAEMVGCTQSFLSQVESGIRQPSLTLATRLHRVTGIPIELFAKEDAGASQ